MSSCLRNQSQDTELIESRVSERWLEVWNSSSGGTRGEALFRASCNHPHIEKLTRELIGLLAVLMAEVYYSKRTHSRISKGKRLIR